MRVGTVAGLSMATAVLLGGSPSGLPAQGSPDSSLLIYDRPTCGACRWELGTPTSVLAIARSSDLWFGRIVGAAADGQGRLYLGDGFQHQVIRVDLKDGAVLRFGRPGRGPGEFDVPQLIAPKDDGGVFVLDPALARLSEFGADGAFLGSFRLPSNWAPPTALVKGGGDDLFVSAVARDSGAGVVHRLDRNGRLLRSFGEPGSAFPGWTMRVQSNGGQFWWDNASKVLWFSRQGPGFELSAYTADGVLKHRILLPKRDLREWTSPLEVVGSNGRVLVRGKRGMGTIALIPLPGGLLANISSVRGDSVGVDVFRTSSAEYIASWTEAWDTPVGAGDGHSRVFAFRLLDEPDVLVRGVRLDTQQSERRDR